MKTFYSVKKLAIIIFFLFLLSSLYLLLNYIYESIHPNYLSFDDIQSYCVESSSNNATSYYVKGIDNYYFCVSKSGNIKLSPDFFIFRKNKNSDKKLTAYINVGGSYDSQKYNYIEYQSFFPDCKGRSIGNSIVYASQNDRKIAKAVIAVLA